VPRRSIVTGGSQGSLALNRVVASWIEEGGAAATQVVWSTGHATYSEFAGLHDPPRVHVLPFIDPMSDAWSVASIAVARSGMMTLAELCAWGIPSVLVPLPTAAANHQWHNARAMAAAGASLVLDQRELDARRLGDAIASLLADAARRKAMGDAARARAHAQAASEIARAVVALARGVRAA